MMTTTEPITASSIRAVWRRDYALFIVFVLIGVLGPWNLTDMVGFWPLHWLVVVYLGYRMGPWFGAAAGILTQLPWYADLGLDEFLPSDYEASFEDIVLAALIGWLAGWLFGRLDRWLAGGGIELTKYLPRSHGPFLAVPYRALERALGEKRDDAQGSSSDWLMPKLRGLGQRANSMVIFPLALVVLNLYFLETSLERPWGNIDFNLLPIASVAVVLAAAAFVTASRRFVTLAFFVWVLSLTALSIADSEGDLDYLYFSILEPANGVGLMIVTWLAAKAGEIWKIPEERARLADLCKPYLCPVQDTPGATLTLILIVLPLCVTLGFQFDGSLFGGGASAQVALEEIVVVARRFSIVSWQPLIPLFALLLVLGSRRDPIGVSNRALVLLLLLALVHIDSSELGPNIGTLSLTAPQVVLLALAPFVGSRLDLERLVVCRGALYGFLLASTLINLYVGGGLRSGVWWSGYMLVSWAVQIALVEAVAAAVRWQAVRWSR